MSVIDQVCDALSARLKAMRERRATFERMGADDAVRSMDVEIDLVKSIADEVLAISAKPALSPTPIVHDIELAGAA